MIQDKHTWIAENLVLQPDQEKKTTLRRKNLQSLTYQTTTKQTRLVLAIMGAWGVYFPPYNLARLAGVTRSAGYHTTVFDCNGELHHKLKDIGLDKAWDSTHYWWWLADNYWERLHPELEPYLLEYVDKIVAANPDVVGFSLYETNYVPSSWMITEVKRRLPNVKIIVGGPECHSPDFVPSEGTDHYVAGEGEQELLNFLQNFENGSPENLPVKLGSTYGDVRLELDTLPMPDYSDYDFSIYKLDDGVSAELSRGCVAQCSFCRETWFWKFRDRHSHTLLDEVEHQVKNYDIHTIWFIDSLVNGNLKELKEFALGVVERKLKIRWMGYARCDGRMDSAYFLDLKRSGCEHLSFGVESGSQQVLDLMNKKIDLESINNNLRDCRQADIMVLVNWIVGFPNETTQSAAHGLSLIWNNRNNIQVFSPGMTFGDDLLSDFGFNRWKYDVSPITAKFMGWWWSLDWTNTKVNRLIRLKLLNIWLTVCKDHGDYIINCQERPNLKNHYILDFAHTEFTETAAIENFDHNIIDTGLGVFADSVVNEVWSFLRMMWRVKGGFTFKLTADKQIDLDEFGSILCSDDHAYTLEFSVTDSGEFVGKFVHVFKHNGEPWMTGTKSFDFEWQGKGFWSADSDAATITEETKSGWADECSETISAETRELNAIESAKHARPKRTISITQA